MKIIEIIYSYPPSIFIARHIMALRENGIEPIVVACDEKSSATLNSASTLNEKWDLGEVHIPIISNKPVQKLSSLRHLLKKHTPIEGRLREKVFSAYLESIKPDLIHFHWGTLADHLYRIPEILHIPYTISLRGSDVQVKPFESQNKYMEIKKAITGAAGIHTVSHALWNHTVKTFELSPDEIYQKTIYTTVPISDHKEMERNDKQKIFVTVGRLHWTKSLPILLIAFKKFTRICPDSKLFIIGDGELLDCINYWIRYLQLNNDVILKGKMNYRELANVILHSNAFIQSSIAEGFSNSTAEAMALGCPVFATDVGGTNEIIEDGVNGFLLDPISPESWSQKLQLVQDEPLMKSIGENARKTAVSRFSKSLHANEFIDFYQKSINRTK